MAALVLFTFNVLIDLMFRSLSVLRTQLADNGCKLSGDHDSVGALRDFPFHHACR